MSGRKVQRGIATYNPAVFVGLNGASASGISASSTMDNGCGLWRCTFVLGAIEVKVTAREQTWVEKEAGSD